MNITGEQRHNFTPNLHRLYDNPLSTRRLLNWFDTYHGIQQKQEQDHKLENISYPVSSN